MPTQTTPPKRPGIFDRAEANLTALLAREIAAKEGEQELAAVIAKIETPAPDVAGNLLTKVNNPSELVSLLPTPAPKPSAQPNDSAPASLSDFNRRMAAESDPATRASFYARHAGAFGLEPSRPAIAAGGPTTQEQFVSQLNAISDPVARGAYYAEHGPSFGY